MAFGTNPSLTRPSIPILDRYLSSAQWAELIAIAKREDLGPGGVDITTHNIMSESVDPSSSLLLDATAVAIFRARASGILSGVALLTSITAAYDPALRVEVLIQDGQLVESGEAIARLSGCWASILAVERVALNFMTHLSGVATLTARYVSAVEGTKAAIYDTRKTLPGMRELQKYAVVCGGGYNHRMGLYDAVLIKDNHLAGLSESDWPASIEVAIRRVLASAPPPIFVELEVDHLSQLEIVLQSQLADQLDVVLLDNMSLDDLKQAVAMRDKRISRLKLEASGGVNLDTIASIAATGVDRIAVGALTHSASALDIGLDIDFDMGSNVEQGSQRHGSP